MTALFPLPPQPAGTPFPTQDWPLGDIPASADCAKLDRLVDHAFAATPPDDLEQTQSLVVIQHGRLLLERYGPWHTAEDTLTSWSMAKSMTQALVGMLVMDGKLDIHAPTHVPEWQAPDDPRRALTLDLLLRMSSGLAFVEEYHPDNPSDVIAMLFGAGKDDTAHFAASFPLEHEPGSFWSYSSGTTNIVAREAARAADAFGPDFEAFMRERLFGPLGMASATPRFDTAGTFIGSSYCFCTARDFARFGLLYLRDGVWDGERLLPEGWVDYARTATFQQPTDSDPYGAHWWLDLAGPGSFSANGHDGQYIVVIPQKDMVIVRNGVTATDKLPNVKAWIADIAACFA
ncbi:MAG TPA: serine hydrolase [Rhizomicrobium sp.]|jgi:CubicO group peptidase (beta-lactamase class C family)|nr:serine hydrolase [Rhizomicrobium sp.]